MISTQIGRLLFRTTALYQHIQKDGESLRAVNANRFRFLGLLPGCAVLRGAAEKENDLEALSAKFDRKLSENTLRASFERPKIAFGPLVFEAGPASVVRLDTTYLDDRVRPRRGRQVGDRDRGGALFCGMLTSQGLICDRKLRLGHTEIERRDRHAHVSRTAPADY